ncbi:MAG: sigma-54 dependent transcriptional regulator [Methylococcaceae bacterium]|jgi:two-component system response regulator FlrC
MQPYDVLIVEDDIALCEALSDTLEIQGYRVITASNGIEALKHLVSKTVRLVLSDVQMPVMDGFALLHNIQLKHPGLPVLLMTAYGTIPKAVEAMQTGAVDYLIKPFEADTLINKVSAYVLSAALTVQEFAVQDPNMQKLYALTSKVAKSTVTVLLQGESGSGKEVIAQYIHQSSSYSNGPFVAINCAAIPENMLEATLFGYEKGAFTGAIQAMPGKFEQAQGGTLLLDEISEMDLNLQAKLLRVLQEKEIERLGSTKKIHLDVRILAATNCKLKELVEQNLFREDLYYRLSVFPISIPPLRARPGDILPLAKELLLRHWPKAKKMPEFTAAAIAKMLAYPWPGNVRELDNVVQRALILKASDWIQADDLIFEELGTNFDIAACAVPLDSVKVGEERSSAEHDSECHDLDEGVRSAEERIILQTLQMENGSRKTTAQKLGISARTLRYKMARMKESGVRIPC